MTEGFIYFVFYLHSDNMPPTSTNPPGRKPPGDSEKPKRPLSEVLRQCEKWLIGPDKLARRKAIELLKNIEDPAKKGVLIKALSYNGASAIDVIVQLGEMKDSLDIDDYQKITDLLRVQRPEIRSAAVQVLSMADSPLITDILKNHLDEEKDPDVLSETADALWRMTLRKKINRSFEDVIMLLENDSEAVRRVTIEHLEENGRLLSENEIVLLGNLLSHEDKNIKLAAVEALYRIKRPRLTSHLFTWYLIEERDAEIQEMMLEVMRGMRVLDDVNQQLHVLMGNPNFASHHKLIANILDDTIPSIPPDAIVPKSSAEVEDIFELVSRSPPELQKKDS